MPSVYSAVKFFWVDCDQSSDVVDHFEVDQVPSLAIIQPHKNSVEKVHQDLSPELLQATLRTQHEFMKNLFDQEKQKAFRDITTLVNSAPIFMFIKGTLEQPKCKFTRKMVETLAPFRYRGIKTYSILDDERIRQWLKFYSNWPTFPQIFVSNKFIGGVDIFCELIENDEFGALLPAECKPLSPEEEFDEFLRTNNVIAFLTTTDEGKPIVDALTKANAISFAIVNLQTETNFAKILHEKHGITKSCLFIDGKICADIEAV